MFQDRFQPDDGFGTGTSITADLKRLAMTGTSRSPPA